jgi:hypothetical protein
MQIQFTSIDEHDVIEYIKNSKYPLAVKRAFYASFAIESNHGKSGINNNINGMQTDGGLWAYSSNYIKGTTEFPESRTGKCRAFATYDKWQDCAEHVMKIFNDRIEGNGGNRQMIPKDPNNFNYFSKGYAEHWIGANQTDADYNDEIKLMNLLYKSAIKLIPG